MHSQYQQGKDDADVPPRSRYSQHDHAGAAVLTPPFTSQAQDQRSSYNLGSQTSTLPISEGGQAQSSVNWTRTNLQPVQISPYSRGTEPSYVRESTSLAESYRGVYPDYGRNEASSLDRYRSSLQERDTGRSNEKDKLSASDSTGKLQGILKNKKEGSQYSGVAEGFSSLGKDHGGYRDMATKKTESSSSLKDVDSDRKWSSSGRNTDSSTKRETLRDNDKNEKLPSHERGGFKYTVVNKDTEESIHNRNQENYRRDVQRSDGSSCVRDRARSFMESGKDGREIERSSYSERKIQLVPYGETESEKLDHRRNERERFSYHEMDRQRSSSIESRHLRYPEDERGDPPLTEREKKLLALVEAQKSYIELVEKERDSVPFSDKQKYKSSSRADRTTSNEKKSDMSSVHKERDRCYSSHWERDRSLSGHRERSRSPSFHRKRSRSPSFHRERSRSPSFHRERSRSPSFHRERDWSPPFYSHREWSPSFDRERNRSPSFDRERDRSPSFDRDKCPSFDRQRDRSPSFQWESNRSLSDYRERDRSSFDRERDASPSFHSDIGRGSFDRNPSPPVYGERERYSTFHRERDRSSLGDNDSYDGRETYSRNSELDRGSISSISYERKSGYQDDQQDAAVHDYDHGQSTGSLSQQDSPVTHQNEFSSFLPEAIGSQSHQSGYESYPSFGLPSNDQPTFAPPSVATGPPPFAPNVSPSASFASTGPPPSSFAPNVPPLSSFASAVPPLSSYAPTVPPPTSYASTGPPPTSYAPTVPPLSSYAPTVPPPMSYAPTVPPPMSYASAVPPPTSYASTVPPPTSYAPTVPPPTSYAPTVPVPPSAPTAPGTTQYAPTAYNQPSGSMPPYGAPLMVPPPQMAPVQARYPDVYNMPVGYGSQPQNAPQIPVYSNIVNPHKDHQPCQKVPEIKNVASTSGNEGLLDSNIHRLISNNSQRSRSLVQIKTSGNKAQLSDSKAINTTNPPQQPKTEKPVKEITAVKNKPGPKSVLTKVDSLKLKKISYVIEALKTTKGSSHDRLQTTVSKCKRLYGVFLKMKCEDSVYNDLQRGRLVTYSISIDDLFLVRCVGKILVDVRRECYDKVVNILTSREPEHILQVQDKQEQFDLAKKLAATKSNPKKQPNPAKLEWSAAVKATKAVVSSKSVGLEGDPPNTKKTIYKVEQPSTVKATKAAVSSKSVGLEGDPPNAKKNINKVEQPSTVKATKAAVSSKSVGLEGDPPNAKKTINKVEQPSTVKATKAAVSSKSVGLEGDPPNAKKTINKVEQPSEDDYPILKKLHDRVVKLKQFNSSSGKVLLELMSSLEVKPDYVCQIRKRSCGSSWFLGTLKVDNVIIGVGAGPKEQKAKDRAYNKACIILRKTFTTVIKGCSSLEMDLLPEHICLSSISIHLPNKMTENKLVRVFKSLKATEKESKEHPDPLKRHEELINHFSKKNGVKVVYMMKEKYDDIYGVATHKCELYLDNILMSTSEDMNGKKARLFAYASARNLLSPYKEGKEALDKIMKFKRLSTADPKDIADVVEIHPSKDVTTRFSSNAKRILARKQRSGVENDTEMFDVDDLILLENHVQAMDRYTNAKAILTHTAMANCITFECLLTEHNTTYRCDLFIQGDKVTSMTAQSEKAASSKAHAYLLFKLYQLCPTISNGKNCPTQVTFFDLVEKAKELGLDVGEEMDTSSEQISESQNASLESQQISETQDVSVTAESANSEKVGEITSQDTETRDLEIKGDLDKSNDMEADNVESEDSVEFIEDEEEDVEYVVIDEEEDEDEDDQMGEFIVVDDADEDEEDDVEYLVTDEAQGDEETESPEMEEEDVENETVIENDKKKNVDKELENSKAEKIENEKFKDVHTRNENEKKRNLEQDKKLEKAKTEKIENETSKDVIVHKKDAETAKVKNDRKRSSLEDTKLVKVKTEKIENENSKDVHEKDDAEKPKAKNEKKTSDVVDKEFKKVKAEKVENEKLTDLHGNEDDDEKTDDEDDMDEFDTEARKSQVKIVHLLIEEMLKDLSEKKDSLTVLSIRGGFDAEDMKYICQLCLDLKLLAKPTTWRTKMQAPRGIVVSQPIIARKLHEILLKNGGTWEHLSIIPKTKLPTLEDFHKINQADQKQKFAQQKPKAKQMAPIPTPDIPPHHVFYPPEMEPGWDMPWYNPHTGPYMMNRPPHPYGPHGPWQGGPFYGPPRMPGEWNQPYWAPGPGPNSKGKKKKNKKMKREASGSLVQISNTAKQRKIEK